MRPLLVALVSAICAVFAAPADAQSFRAGWANVMVQDIEPFELMVWYPTDAAEVPWRAGPFEISASRNVAISGVARLPTVLLSHGSGGAPVNHRNLAAHLARDGFIVMAPSHVGDSRGSPRAPRPLVDRPRQARKALDAMLADPRFSQRVNLARIGMVGFSAGATTALILAGARPDFERFSTYCSDHADDRGACGRTGRNGANAPVWQHVEEIRLKAIVLMDPLAALFGAEDLVQVALPVLLYRPESDDYLKSTGNALALATGLPRPPQQIVVPGSHFVFVDPCPPAVASEAAAICKDAPGIDRAAIHRRIRDEISNFLRSNL